MVEKFPKVEPTLEAIDKFIAGHYASCFDVLEHFRFARQRIAELEAERDALRTEVEASRRILERHQDEAKITDRIAEERNEAVALLRETRDKHDTEAWSRAEAFLARYPEKKPQGKGEE